MPGQALQEVFSFTKHGLFVRHGGLSFFAIGISILSVYRGRSSGSEMTGRLLRPHHQHATIHARWSIVRLPSRAISLNLFHTIPPTVPTEIHPSICRRRVADDVARRSARRLSNVRAPLARVVTRSALKSSALGSHGREVGRSLVRGEGLTVDNREVEPRLAGVPMNGQLQLVLVRVGDLGVWGAFHDGADVVLCKRISDQVQRE